MGVSGEFLWYHRRLLPEQEARLIEAVLAPKGPEFDRLNWPTLIV